MRQTNEIKGIMSAMESLRNDWTISKSSRFRRNRPGVTISGTAADYHFRNENDYYKAMEMARDFDRNDCVVSQGVSRLIDNVGPGDFLCDPQTSDPILNKDLHDRFYDWANNPDACDRAGELAFQDLARLVFRHVIIDGDIDVLPLKDGSLQLIEGHRIKTPSGTKENVVLGVRLDEYRRQIEHWFAKDEIDPLAVVKSFADITPYKVRDDDGHRQIFHIYDPRRVSQTRGMTACAPIADMIGMHDDTQFATLVKQQTSAAFAILHEYALEAPQPASEGTIGETEEQTLADGRARTIDGVAAGVEYFGRPGETLKGYSPNIPSPEYFKHAMMILTFIAINLNLPVSVLLLDPSNTNFSGWRGAIDQARGSWRRIQRWLIRQFHGPVYEWKLRQWIAEDAAMRSASETTPDFYKHVWHPPTWPYIEPSKDARADQLIIDNNLNSPRRVHAERGRDYDVMVNEIITDRKAVIIAALTAANEINKDHPEAAVDWRELAGPSFRKTTAMAKDQDGDGEIDEANGGEGTQQNEQ